MIIAVPARGGSKRVPRKNLQPLAGVPLLAHTLRAVAGAGLDAPVFVSTEDAEIAALATEYRVRAVDRPPDLAEDAASTEAVLLHVLDTVAGEGVAPTWIMTLPPTAPFRRAETIRAFADEVRRHPEAQDCLISVTEDRGDYWLMEKDGVLRRLFPDAPRRQQDRTPLYEENSAVYVTRVKALRATGSILGRRVRGLPIDPLEAFDINTARDLQIAEAIGRLDTLLLSEPAP